MAQKHQERFSKIDVQHYKFELTLSDASDEIEGMADSYPDRFVLCPASLDGYRRSSARGARLGIGP